MATQTLTQPIDEKLLSTLCHIRAISDEIESIHNSFANIMDDLFEAYNKLVVDLRDAKLPTKTDLESITQRLHDLRHACDANDVTISHASNAVDFLLGNVVRLPNGDIIAAEEATENEYAYSESMFGGAGELRFGVSEAERLSTDALSDRIADALRARIERAE